VVAVAGEVGLEEARREVSARLGGWTGAPGAADGPGAPGRPGPPPAGRAARVETVQRDLAQATLFFGQATVTPTHPDHHALDVARHVLGGGSSSRLGQRIREERGLAYAVGTGYVAGRLAGLFLVDAQTENASVREVLALARAELARLRHERIPETELARAKAYVVGSFALRLATTGQVADLLLAAERHGLTLDYPDRYRRAIQAVTADDVLRATRTHWDPDQMSLALVGNLREAGITGP
jgi:zinc protease